MCGMSCCDALQVERAAFERALLAGEPSQRSAVGSASEFEQHQDVSPACKPLAPQPCSMHACMCIRHGSLPVLRMHMLAKSGSLLQQ